MSLKKLGGLCCSLFKLLNKSRLMLGLVFLMILVIGLITSLIMRSIIYKKIYTLGMLLS